MDGNIMLLIEMLSFLVMILFFYFTSEVFMLLWCVSDVPEMLFYLSLMFDVYSFVLYQWWYTVEINV